MRLIFCLDQNGGMAFNGRRQSRDREIIADILKQTQGRLYVGAYSTPLFANAPGVVSVPNPVAAAKEGDSCFLEALPEEKPAATEIVLYRFNRVYPADVQFDSGLLSGFTLAEKTEIAGYSHETITREVYRK